jgi:hypothetical protein
MASITAASIFSAGDLNIGNLITRMGKNSDV